MAIEFHMIFQTNLTFSVDGHSYFTHIPPVSLETEFSANATQIPKKRKYVKIDNLTVE